MTHSNHVNKNTELRRKNSAYSSLPPKELSDYVSLPSPILEDTLPETEPLKEEYSTDSNADLLDEYSPRVCDAFPPNQKPLKELEAFSRSGKRFFIATGGTGRGKTTATLLFICNLLLKLGGHAISFVHSRVLGEVQKDKFEENCALLQDDICRCLLYYSGNDDNDQIRACNPEHTLYITTPFMYSGTLTHYSLLLTPDQIDSLADFKDAEGWQGVFSSDDYKWAKTLMTPSVVFIDEIDSYPPYTLHCLAILVRLLIKRNPDMYVILSSGTLGNPDWIAKLFFGLNEDYMILPGTGRRGMTSISVYYEEKPMQLLHEAIHGIKKSITKELEKLHPNSATIDNLPVKNLFFINDKLEIAIREIIGDFDDYFTTLHGDMNPKLLKQKIREFEQKILKFSLVTTDIAQAGLDPPNANWMISYGTPRSNRVYLQRRGRVVRDPAQQGHIDIILRSSVPHERLLADPANRQKLKEYILREESPPYPIPLYSPKMLQYAIVMGLIFGQWDILEFLRDLTGKKDELFQKELQKTYRYLLEKKVITLGNGEEVRPTAKTRNWVYKFPRINFESDLYTVYRKTVDGQEELGKIRYSRLLRNGLPSQIIPYLNGNYKVLSINTKKNEVYVKKSRQPISYYKNKVSSFYWITNIRAKNPLTGNALVNIQRKERVDLVDRRTKDLGSSSEDYNSIRHFSALFIPHAITLNMSNQLSDTYKALNLDSSYFKTIEFYDEQLKHGTALIDTTGLDFARMIYDHWQTSFQPFEKTQISHSNKYIPPKKKFQISSFRLLRDLKLYDKKWMIVGDVHFNGASLYVRGEEIDIYDYCQLLVAPLSHASTIVLIGDIQDHTDAVNRTKAKKQFDTLLETLNEADLIEKTYFIKGNHDPKSRYYLWQKEVQVYSHLRIPLTPYQDLVISHGDNMGLEPLMEKKVITDSDIDLWRSNLKYRVDGKQIRINDLLIVGHTHNIYGYCNRKGYTLAVPSFKKYWLSPQKNLGWLGLFYYGSPEDPWDWKIAIEKP